VSDLTGLNCHTHLICAACWMDKAPGRTAKERPGEPATQCCFCGSDTTSGIFCRAEPEETQCECVPTHV